MRELINELLSAIDRGARCVWCTVAATRGSTPQKPGAMMIVYEDGRQSGTLGGGCVEAEVRRRALAALAASNAMPTIHTFHLDDDFGWDDGLICGGRMTIATEPITAERREYLQRLAERLEASNGHVEVIALGANRIGVPAGDRALFDACNQPIDAARHVQELSILLPPLTTHSRPSVVEDFAVLPTPPRIRLIVVGAGHVGQAVARLAEETNFEVWVLDDRDKFANPERLPTAQRIIVGDIAQELITLKGSITPSTFVLIVTRGHNHDEEALFHVVNAPAGYIGMIGSKRKVRLIFDDLLTKGISPEALARVRAPVGLDIGSQSVPEIAISIMAELISVRNRGPATK